MTGSHCCTAETNSNFQRNYPPIKNKRYIYIYTQKQNKKKQEHKVYHPQAWLFYRPLDYILIFVE